MAKDTPREILIVVELGLNVIRIKPQRTEVQTLQSFESNRILGCSSSSWKGWWPFYNNPDCFITRRLLIFFEKKLDCIVVIVFGAEAKTMDGKKCFCLKFSDAHLTHRRERKNSQLPSWISKSLPPYVFQQSIGFWVRLVEHNVLGQTLLHHN